MRTWLGFALVVFVITLVVNLGVTAVWPDSRVDLYTSAVVAAATSVALSIIRWRSRARGD